MDSNTRAYQEIFSGGTAVGTICSAYGNQTVTGGMALDTTISSGGIQALTSGGISLNATITSGGTQSATEGGLLAGRQIIETGGSASGGTLTETTVNGSAVKGEQIVSGTAINLTVAGGGTQSVLSGGTANGVTLDGGALRLAPGALASGTIGGHGSVAVYTDDTFSSVDSSAIIPLGGEEHFSSFTVSGGVLNTPNGFLIDSGGGITVNSGGTMVVGGGVLVTTSGSSLTVSAGGMLSAGSVSTENGGEISMSGGRLAASGGITVRHALTNAYGDVAAGTSLTVGGGATQPGSGKALNLSAGSNIAISGAATVNEISAGGDVDAAGQALSASRIRAGGALTVESVTADSLSAASLSARTNVRISGGGLFLASGGVANSMSIAGTVSASAQGRPALSAETGIEFGDGLFFLVPAGGAVGPCGDGVAVLDASGNPAETVEIGPLPPVEAALKWKYAKNANGWYCAQLALAWHPAFAEEIGNMRLLFADRTDAQGRRTAYLVDPSTVIDPLGTTETYRDVEYRVAPVDLSVFADVAIGSRAVYGVSDATMASSLASVPKAERKICLRVANRDLSTVEPVANKLAILAWDVGDESFFLPLAETMSSVVDGDVAPQPAPQPAPRPLSVAEANLATAFGLAPAAVARGAVTCRIASMGFGADGSAEGTFEIAAEDAGRVVAESGELTPGVKLAVLGAASLGGAFEPLDPAACGVELLSRRPPYAFRVAAPGKNAFFKIRLEAEDLFE